MRTAIIQYRIVYASANLAIASTLFSAIEIPAQKARIGSLTLAFLLRWRFYFASVCWTLAFKGARIRSLTLAFLLR
jgi:hypothetical protein